MDTEKDDPRDVSYDFPISDEQLARMVEANDKRHLRPPSPDMSEYIRRSNHGFYKNFNDVDDLDGSSLLARKKACEVSPFVVALSCKNSSDLQQSSSGIVVEYKGITKILTSAYIIGGHSNALGLEVDILFPSGKKMNGKVSLIDKEHNLAFIHGELDGIHGISFSSELAVLDDDVISLGRNATFGLMASRGKVNNRRDVLESDDLMSSSCTISESGIGGPLVNISTGLVVGMNVYVQQKSTLYMPSIILNQCFQQLLDYGRVERPCLGLKTRNIAEKKLNELELIYEKFPSTDGIMVNEVKKKSPADKAGISVGDIITHFDGIPISSPVQLADLLLESGTLSLKRKRKRNKTHEVKVGIQRPATCTEFDATIIFKYSTSPYVNSWPLVPLDVPIVECCVYDYHSFQRGTTSSNAVSTSSNAVSTHDLAQRLAND